MSASRILGQSVPCLLNAFPGWKQPVHCRLFGTVSATPAVAADAANTTPGVAITGGTSGIYTVTFPACRNIAGINIQVYAPAPETPGASYTAGIDAAEIDATAGEFQFTTYARDNGDDEALPNGNVVDITFWLDLG
jgi:hypothetical protein